MNNTNINSMRLYMKVYRIFVIMLSMSYADQWAYSELSFQFSENTKSVIVGNTVIFNVKIMNTGNSGIFFHGNTIDLSGNWKYINILNDEQFYSTIPYPITQGSSWEGNIFTISVGETAEPGTYVGWYYLFGGENEDADTLLATLNFSITVNPKPIPVDFDSDDDVDLEDFAIFVYYWMDETCTVENNFCDGTDTDNNGKVDFQDLVNFVSHWLEGTLVQ
jgi:hypothetical protein